MKALLPKFTAVITQFKKRWKMSVVVILILGLAGGWYLQQTQATTPELEFISPTRQDIVATLEVSGVVDAKEKARLRFLAGGKVVYVGAKVGDTVRRGQTLATIDRAALQKQLEQQLNTYKRQRNAFDEFLDDQKDQVLDTSDERARDDSQLKLNDTVLSVEQQSIAIQNTVLSAPFAGLVTVAPTTTPGVQLSASDFYEVIKPETLIFRAAVDEADISKVIIDQPAVVTLDAFPDTPVSTKVSFISFTSSESSTGTVFLVEFPMEQTVDGNLLRLGMNGDIAIELDRATNVLTVPLDATKERDGKTYVDVKTGEQTYEEREIAVGIMTDEQVEVLSGLSESDSVLLP